MAGASNHPEDFLPLSPSQFYILLVLAEHDLHGYGIMQSVKIRTKGRIRIGPGTLYSAIDRMIERGWIVETDSLQPNQDDERRRTYHLTDFGMRVARAEAQRLAATVQDARELGLLTKFAF
ncbi:MAG: helix-turn-helix transcriptional regulator [Anaerolineaceae bacterium]|nr:helix-turn-helix transcriptional regulator [Anaerolineaceae bacterium]